MNLFQLSIKSVKHYKKASIMLALGIAISTAIITGALIVGDSVSHSLKQTVDYRLGDVEQAVIAGDRFFSYGTDGYTTQLQKYIDDDITAVLAVNGMLNQVGGGNRLNNVSIWGIDSSFSQTSGAGNAFDSLMDDQVIISENVALHTGLKIGDEFILNIRKASLVPLSAPFVSEEEKTISRRLIITKILTKEELGRFGLQNSQTAPFNVFMQIEYLQEALDLEDKANLVLSNGCGITEEIAQKAFGYKDAGVQLEVLDSAVNVFSDRVFFDQTLKHAIKHTYTEAKPAITYFVNDIQTSRKSCPYSFVSTLPNLQLNEMIINRWLAEDLELTLGDSVTIDYFSIGPLRKLDSNSAVFIVKDIIDLREEHRYLMPDLPGLSDAGNCKDWDTGVPIDLDAIRDKDEDYWEEFKGSPKAFIALQTAEQIWSNRFGSYTSWTIPLSELPDQATFLNGGIDPLDLGYEVRNVREEGLYAATNGTEFYSLFIGLSFFVIVAGLILSVLLFRSNLDNRIAQIGSFKAIGYSERQIAKVFMSEAALVAIIGGVLGLFLAVLYNQMVFWALNDVWNSIVRTEVLEVFIRPLTLLGGFVISVLISLFFLRLSLKRFMKHMVTTLQKLGRTKTKSPFWNKAGFALIWFLLGVGIIVKQFIQNSQQDAFQFFLAGSFFLIGFLLLIYNILSRPTISNKALTLTLLSRRNRAVNLRRSMMLVIMLSLGVFIVIGTGANRHDLHSDANNARSGTGGFEYFAEATVPILQDLNDPQVKAAYSLPISLSFVQMRAQAGDDASCLNLNRISRPRILGVNSRALQARFSFQTFSDVRIDYPWSLLNEKEGDYIPAIADQTVIQWSLGKKVGDTLMYTNEAGEPLILKLMAGSSPSIFQGNVIIHDKFFLEHFPSSSGSSVFLLDGDTTALAEELNMAFKDNGWSMMHTADRLAMFKSVENTYLSIFLILGILGMIIGSIGVAVILARSIQERKKELSLLIAIGYSKKQLITMLIRELYGLQLFALLAGFLSALISILPSLQNVQNVPVQFLMLLVLILLVNGFVWMYFISRSQIRKLNIVRSIRAE